LKILISTKNLYEVNLHDKMLSWCDIFVCLSNLGFPFPFP
jgi:hypothetical protein